eukprot:3915791-Rhodomonas_salina.1
MTGSVSVGAWGPANVRGDDVELREEKLRQMLVAAYPSQYRTPRSKRVGPRSPSTEHRVARGMSVPSIAQQMRRCIAPCVYQYWTWHSRRVG